jgi:hypothetical protein
VTPSLYLTIIGISIAAGGLFGWISTYFYSGLISWTGKWLKGTADTSTILHVLAYAMIPSIISLIFLIPQFATYGVEVYKKDGDINKRWFNHKYYFLVIHGSRISTRLLDNLPMRYWHF